MTALNSDLKFVRSSWKLRSWVDIACYVGVMSCELIVQCQRFCIMYVAVEDEKKRSTKRKEMRRMMHDRGHEVIGHIADVEGEMRVDSRKKMKKKKKTKQVVPRGGWEGGRLVCEDIGRLDARISTEFCLGHRSDLLSLLDIKRDIQDSRVSGRAELLHALTTSRISVPYSKLPTMHKPPRAL